MENIIRGRVVYGIGGGTFTVATNPTKYVIKLCNYYLQYMITHLYKLLYCMRNYVSLEDCRFFRKLQPLFYTGILCSLKFEAPLINGLP